ncbi:hypothetical protein GW17_00047947 [Ensete ventricosum]|nr:hypothetical protein GW17_00047947 [Ensete ventricosum]
MSYRWTLQIRFEHNYAMSLDGWTRFFWSLIERPQTIVPKMLQCVNQYVVAKASVVGKCEDHKRPCDLVGTTEQLLPETHIQAGASQDAHPRPDRPLSGFLGSCRPTLTSLRTRVTSCADSSTTA